MNLSSLFSVCVFVLALAVVPQSALADKTPDTNNASINGTSGDRNDNSSGSDNNASTLRSTNHDDYYIRFLAPKFQGKCLTFDPNDDHYAKFIDCSTKSSVYQYQQWYYDMKFGYIKSYHNSYQNWCLTLDDPHRPRNSHRVGYLRMAPCHGGVNQQWYYNEFNEYRFRSGLGFHDYCMDWCRDCGNYVHTRKCDSGHDKDQQYIVGDKFYF